MSVPSIVHFAWRDRPALIEVAFPAQKISIEAQAERKAGAGQTLTALGSYWKGRKPLVLVRACLLASLLPATEDPEADLEVFELLMAMDDDAFIDRVKSVSKDDVKRWGGEFCDQLLDAHGEWRVAKEVRRELLGRVLARMPYSERLNRRSFRPEELEESSYARVWHRVNAHLGTQATSHAELVEQIGVLRFGRRPKVADTFCGGGSIPFEAARLGCDVYASDLNPVACMLTWGAFNVIGADLNRRQELGAAQESVVRVVDAEIARLGIEHEGDDSWIRLTDHDRSCLGGSWTLDEEGRAVPPNTNLFEVRCPRTGWLVPWMKTRWADADHRLVFELKPITSEKRYAVVVAEISSDKDWKAAAEGTIRRRDHGVRLVHSPPGQGEVSVPIANRAKAYLYCLETRCPESGWRVPLATSWVISKNKRCVARLEPDRERKRFDIAIIQNATDADLSRAAQGTVQEGNLAYMLDGEVHRTSIKTLRGDRRIDGESRNDLRAWEKGDVAPRAADLFQERLYCIQWSAADDLRDTYFAAPTDEDLAREAFVETTVIQVLSDWQDEGLVPDMAIEPGAETDVPIRTRGWTFWHHLFPPRHLYELGLTLRATRAIADEQLRASTVLSLPILLDRTSRLGQWRVGHSGKLGVAAAGDYCEHVFYNQALNVFWNYACRSFLDLQDSLSITSKSDPIRASATVETCEAARIAVDNDIFITDPPYADAVEYHEITEYFIAWLRRNPPVPFAKWLWDSRRALAIQGSDEVFRAEMIKAYRAMVNHMPDNGLQIVMFTHQEARVWGDMAGIFWGAGLRVTGAWYIATETTSELKKGGYVQGTVILVLRKRMGSDRAWADELGVEIRAEVSRQIETMTGLNQRTKGHGRSENLFEDADLQMAGYAAALRVLTGYTHINGVDMTREATRSRTKGETSVVDELIDLAVAIANEALVPEGLSQQVWDRLTGSERFYMRMIDIESSGAKKLENYQNFAKAFRVSQWQPLMASTTPNDARLKSAAEFKRSEFQGSEFSTSALRAVLFALYEIETEVDSDIVLGHLRDHVQGYYERRAMIIDVSGFIARVLEGRRPEEAFAARVLRDMVKNERLGA